MKPVVARGVSSDRNSIAPIGMTKNTASQRTPGPLSPYGARRFPSRACRALSVWLRGSAGDDRVEYAVPLVQLALALEVEVLVRLRVHRRGREHQRAVRH